MRTKRYGLRADIHVIKTGPAITHASMMNW